MELDRLKNQDGEINRNIMEETERAWKAEVRRATVLKVWIWGFQVVHTFSMGLYTKLYKYATIEPLNTGPVTFAFENPSAPPHW